MIKFFLILIATHLLTGSFYDFSINDIEGNTIDFSDFKGKKVLIVNTASNSSQVSQYQSLEQLYQKYKDSLVIIAVPSNSFGNDTATNTAINSFIQTNYHVHYLVAGKTLVTGESQSALFTWLTHVEKNGMINNPINGDFFKFLINSSGTLIGTFAPSVDPMSDEVQTAIAQ